MASPSGRAVAASPSSPSVSPVPASIPDAITPGHWVVEPWSAKEGQVVAKYNGKASLICAGVMLPDAHLIAASKKLLSAANEAFDFLGGVDGAAEIRDTLLAAILATQTKESTR